MFVSGAMPSGVASVSKLNNLLRTMQDAFNAKQIPVAEQACRDVLAFAPDHPLALHVLGVIQRDAGNLRRRPKCCDVPSPPNRAMQSYSAS